MGHTPTREPSAAEIPSALTATWQAAGYDAVPLAHAGLDATLRSTRVPDEAPRPPRLDDVTLGPVLGEGGMGVVQLGRQRSLQREVAVKRLRTPEERGDTDADRATALLLREARITGALEHPNVVPIHLLTEDDGGEPLIVMKRIEGRPLSELLARHTSTAERLSDATLRAHLAVLVQVARALEFAHRRRVVHRDVKPANVMVGSFGEVYLVDWGIAAALEPPPEGVPPARAVRSIEGTPTYLAPEMAAARGEDIDERTDVYLLGATLYEVLAGQPPHVAPTVQGAIVAAYLSTPAPLPPEVPEELAAIVSHAMARERSARMPSAEAFAEALEGFLQHRGSIQLAAEAQRRVRELAALPRAQASGPLAPHEYALFHEARFGFEQALASWPDNPVALEARSTLLRTMIELELSRGSPSAARVLVGALSDVGKELVARVEEAVAKERAEHARLAALAHDADLRVGAEARERLTYAAALAWALSCFAAAATTRSGALVFDHGLFALVNVGFLVGTALSMGLARESLANQVSRRVAYTTCLVFTAGAVLWPLLGALGLSMAECTCVGGVVAALLWTTATFTIGLAWLPMVLGQVLVAIGAWLWPSHHLEIFGALGGLQTAIAARLMRRHEGAR
jgi:predicted Ser/Thr protein kinase